MVGEEQACKIYEHWNGQQVSFPTRLYSRDYVCSQVNKEYDGKNLKELSKKYRYSERHIRRMISEGSIKSTEGKKGGTYEKRKKS